MLLFSILIAYNDLYLHKLRNYLSMKTIFLVMLRAPHKAIGDWDSVEERFRKRLAS